MNLRTTGLWKLGYNTVKSVTEAGGYASSMTLSNGQTVNFKSAADVTISAATETGSASWLEPWIYAYITLTNNRLERVMIPCPMYYNSVKNNWQDQVTATIGSWSGGSAEVQLSNPAQTKYYVNMPSSGSWSRDYCLLGETVYVTIGGKQYSHWFSNANV